MSNRTLAVFAGFFALLTLGFSIVVPFQVLKAAAINNVADLEIPLLALSGFMGVFACVALLVLAFKVINLSNGGQPLGMPEGSIRALIAIFLIVTLGMSALFLLGPSQHQQAASKGPKSAQDSGSQSQDNKSQSSAATNSAASSGFQLAALENPPAQAEGTPPGKATPDDSETKNGNATTTETNQDADDLAKQLLTLLGGLVTTIVGFYFGSQTANSALTKGVQAATDAIKASK